MIAVKKSQEGSGLAFQLITKNGKKSLMHSINLDPKSDVYQRTQQRISDDQRNQKEDREILKDRAIRLNEDQAKTNSDHSESEDSQ